MLVRSTLALLSLAAWAAGRPRHHQFPLDLSHIAEEDCPKVMIFGVRGTLEAAGGVGAMQELTEELLKIKGSQNHSLEYPASGISIGEDGKPDYNLNEYAWSKTVGGDNLRYQVGVFNEICPDTPLVLMGYSQGAHVVGDAVCGVGPGMWPMRPRINDDARGKVAAIIQFGDPTNDKDMPWHHGTSTGSGFFPRMYWNACSDVGSVWRSYCDKGDPFCTRGLKIDAHKHYAEDYFDNTVDFIKSKLKAAGVNCRMSHEL